MLIILKSQARTANRECPLYSLLLFFNFFNIYESDQSIENYNLNLFDKPGEFKKMNSSLKCS